MKQNWFERWVIHAILGFFLLVTILIALIGMILGLIFLATHGLIQTIFVLIIYGISAGLGNEVFG